MTVAFESPAFLMESNYTNFKWLVTEIGDRETAERMVGTATVIGIMFDYPIPVVTDGKNGKVGVIWVEETDSLITGYGLSTGNRDG